VQQEEWEETENDGSTFPECLPGWTDLTAEEQRQVWEDFAFLPDQRNIEKGKIKKIKKTVSFAS
jgi:hypothetical protein